ncbi:MAG: hypothetical protein AAF447_18375 [Myxococcota bacterium]
MLRLRPFALALALALALTACGEDGPAGPVGMDAGTASCVPSEQTWTTEVAPLVAERCGTCHGAEPAFGAPFPLLDYAALVAGDEGERIIDRMHVRVGEGSMPPTGVPWPSVAQREIIVDWASCGTGAVTVGEGATRPPFTSPGEPPAGLEVIDLLADGFELGPNEVDRYVDLDFANLTDEDVFIRRFEPVVDDVRVIHHFTVRRGDPRLGDAGMEYLYAWAPGTGAFEFPEGGTRLSPGDNLRLQIHYNNGGRFDDVSDSSGVRLYVAPPGGTEHLMVDPGPGAFGFRVPARSVETIEDTCVVNEDVTVLAAAPHMHEIGQDFEVLVDGEQQLALEAWDFDSQIFYELPLELRAGQELTIRCTFRNDESTDVFAGPRTQDEMCYLFTYVFPAVEDFCRPPGGSELDYMPGVCIDNPRSADTVNATATSTGPAWDAEGVLPNFHRSATRLVLETDFPALTTVADVTLAGQLRHEEGFVEVDAAVHLVAPFGGFEEGAQIPFTGAGSLRERAGPSTFDASCPEAGESPYTLGTVDGVPALSFSFPGSPVPITAWVFFD